MQQVQMPNVCDCKEIRRAKVSYTLDSKGEEEKGGEDERKQNKEYQTSWTDLQLTLAEHEERSRKAATSWTAQEIIRLGWLQRQP